MAAPNNTLKAARAVGRRDWDRVISLQQDSLSADPDNQFALHMLGLAYERKGDLESAKHYYGRVLAQDARCASTLRSLARIYATESDHDIAYHYVVKGLCANDDSDLRMPSWLRTLAILLCKIRHPTLAWSAIRDRVLASDRGDDDWRDWAIEYKRWYESNHPHTEQPNVH